MDNGVLLAVAVFLLAGVLAGLIVVLRWRLPADVLAEVEAVAASIRESLGELATEERVRWMAGYIYDVAVSPEQQSRVSREEFETLVWQAVERWMTIKAATELGTSALASARLENGR